MKKSKLILIAVSVVIVVLAVFGFYLRFGLPSAGKPENIKVEVTAERVARGEYLANHVYACMDCHSTRDWNRFTGPLKPGTLGQGGEIFDKNSGVPGTVYSRNITPAALGSWTDGEILRAIAGGVSKDGRALFPIMPYVNYSKTDREDLYAIIAYLRSIPPVANQVPESKVNFPMSLIIKTIPKKPIFTKMPDPADTLAYGAYLLNAASCADCHTRMVKGKPVKGMELAGGFAFPLPTGGTVTSANLTPDKATGLGGWTEQSFVDQFRLYADSTYIPDKVSKGDYNTMMPWMMYGKMKADDLKAIWRHLQTIPAVKNEVTKFTPAN